MKFIGSPFKSLNSCMRLLRIKGDGKRYEIKIYTLVMVL